MEANNNSNINQSELTDLYVNKEAYKSSMEYNPTNTITNKQFNYNAYANLGALYPSSVEDQRKTTSRLFNSEVETIFKDKESKEDYYKKIKDYQEKELQYLKKANKNDCVGKIFSTQNYKSKGSSYSSAFEYDENKKKETLEHDFDNHYKKSFMKTYEEDRLKHKIIIRK